MGVLFVCMFSCYICVMEASLKRILIVDDALFMRMVIKNMLVNNGFDVVGEAENGLEAIEKAKELKPDIITLDLTMPVMDGMEALKVLVKEVPGSSVVMVSAMGQEIRVRQSIENGAKGFIVKPYKEGMVLRILRDL